jgi:hypothetical protein
VQGVLPDDFIARKELIFSEKESLADHGELSLKTASPVIIHLGQDTSVAIGDIVLGSPCSPRVGAQDVDGVE